MMYFPIIGVSFKLYVSPQSLVIEITNMISQSTNVTVTAATTVYHEKFCISIE